MPHTPEHDDEQEQGEATEPQPPQPATPIVGEDGRVRVVAPDGTFGSVSPDRLEAFADENPGARLATEEDIAERRRREEQQGIAREVQTGVEAGADLITLGGLSLATRALDEEAAADMALRRELNPLATTTGEVLGAGASLLATGGLGAAGTAARGGRVAQALARTPAGFVTRQAARLESAAAGRGLAARAASTATAGAIEGAAFGAGQGLSEAALDTDHELTAERVLASVSRNAGDTAILGGLAAGALPLAGAALRRGGRGIAQKLGKGRKTAGTAIDVAGDSGLAARSTFQNIQDIATAPARLDDEIQTATQRVHELGSESQRLFDDWMDEGRVSVKLDKADELIRADPPAGIDHAVSDAVGRFQDFERRLGAMLEPDALIEANDFGVGKLRSAHKKLKESVRRIEEVGREALDSADPERASAALSKIFREGDSYKREFGRLTKRVGRGQSADMFTAEVMTTMYERDLRTVLEDPTLFGQGAADLQEAVNKRFTEYLTVSNGLGKNLLESSTDASMRGADPFKSVRQVDSGKAATLVRKFGDAESATRDNLIVRGLDTQASLVEEMAARYDAGPELQAAARKIRENAEAMKATLERVKRTREDADKWKTISGLADGIPLVDGGKLARGVATAANLATRAGQKLGALSSAAGGVDAQIGTSVRRFLARKGAATGSLSGVAQGAQARREESQHERYRKLYAAVQEFEQDPENAVRRAMRNAGDVGSSAPATAGAMARKSVQAAGYLSDKLPRKPLKASLVTQNPDEPPDLSAAELAQFMEHAKGALDPVGVIEDIEKGNITPTKVRALREVWPRIYEDVQERIMREMDRLEEPPPYAQRLELGLLFDVPTDPALEGEFMAAIQEAGAQPLPSEEAGEPMLSPSQRKAPEVASQFTTRSAEIAQRR